MDLIALLIIGGLAGWIAGKLIRGTGFGFVVNIVVGVLGGMVGGKLFALFGVPPGGWLLRLAMAVVGAALLLALIQLVRRPAD
ncbi:MAG: GlsB/YeaQ/YmgE family stress response membrane protein [Geminicoccaceae bacterium]